MNQAHTIKDLYKLPVHPAADLLPPASDDEIAGMAADIKANGLQHPLIVFVDNREEANGAEGPWPEYLLDGRNRLAAVKRLRGFDPSFGALSSDRIKRVRAIKLVSHVSGRRSATRWETSVDPVSFVLSMNVHRRHLSVEQRKELVKQYGPHVSNRKIGRDLGLDHKTVAKARNGASNGENPQKTQPAERAKAAVEANPEASNRELAREAKVSEPTIRRARKATPLQADPEPATQVVRKRRDTKGAERALSELLEQFDTPTLKKAWANLGLA